jgi:hypothetical protein
MVLTLCLICGVLATPGSPAAASEALAGYEKSRRVIILMFSKDYRSRSFVRSRLRQLGVPSTNTWFRTLSTCTNES